MLRIKVNKSMWIAYDFETLKWCNKFLLWTATEEPDHLSASSSKQSLKWSNATGDHSLLKPVAKFQGRETLRRQGWDDAEGLYKSTATSNLISSWASTSHSNKMLKHNSLYTVFLTATGLVPLKNKLDL